MEILQAIKTRRSIRKYQDKAIPTEVIKDILEAAMFAPSAGNEQPWQFVVVRKRELLEKVGGINPYAAFAKNAPVAILVAGDTTLEKCPGYWAEDCSACAQNMIASCSKEVGGRSPWP